jgi:hypothetical protein
MAMDWPMPEPEPVTMATLPARRPDMACSLPSGVEVDARIDAFGLALWR